jgi:ribosomal protein S18 acetylase RimI-like enzyme
LNSSLFNLGSVWAINTGIESADLNLVWNEKPLTVRDQNIIQCIKKHFQSVGLPFWWWVFPRAKSAITSDMLKSESFDLVDSIPSLIADLTAMPDNDLYTANIQIIRVKNREELSLWENVSFQGFEFPPDTRQQYKRFVNTFDICPDSPQNAFLVCSKGRPVATALLILHKNTSGIYFVSTLSECRKRGIGLAATCAVMKFAAQAGAQFCTLQSSPAGLRVYQKAGFKEYCRVDVYSLKHQAQAT